MHSGRDRVLAHYTPLVYNRNKSAFNSTIFPVPVKMQLNHGPRGPSNAFAALRNALEVRVNLATMALCRCNQV